LEYRRLGGSGFKIPALILGTATFGGGNEFFKKWGSTDVQEATSLVDAAMDMGCTMFDTADAYSAACLNRSWARRSKGDATSC